MFWKIISFFWIVHFKLLIYEKIIEESFLLPFKARIFLSPKVSNNCINWSFALPFCQFLSFHRWYLFDNFWSVRVFIKDRLYTIWCHFLNIWKIWSLLMHFFAYCALWKDLGSVIRGAGVRGAGICFITSDL